jgi:hypothetical protein
MQKVIKYSKDLQGMEEHIYTVFASVLVKYIVRMFKWSALCECSSEVLCSSVLGTYEYFVQVF